jgi:chromosome segregation ATPase
MDTTASQEVQDAKKQIERARRLKNRHEAQQEVYQENLQSWEDDCEAAGLEPDREALAQEKRRLETKLGDLMDQLKEQTAELRELLDGVEA